MSRRRSSSRRRLHGIFLLDKPTGASSNRVLQQVKRLFNADKAGHTGTLDPLATGMLPICFGEATKLSHYLLDANKGYETVLHLGITTDSLDADGEVLEQRPLPADLSAEQVTQICREFTGPIEQVPPMVSALKVDGKRLYTLAREGVTVERNPRQIVIESLIVADYQPPLVTLQVVCSKGTYIRSLVDDIGQRLGCGAHVKTLRRTFVSPFQGRTSTTLETLEQCANPDGLLLPMDSCVPHLSAIDLTEQQLNQFRQGRTVDPSALVEQGPSGLTRRVSAGAEGETEWLRVYGPEGGDLLGIAQRGPFGEIAPKRVFQLS
ncbi:MAG: tRNA pseudouridine(55) synthase TruB [Gammaproteobacteria bacterium]|nr:tRNA pseudouridine(55) synthase TruB [Gammaproteobacteria bacterium]